MKLNMDSFRLARRVALATGATRALGEVVASALAEARASLASLASLARSERVPAPDLPSYLASDAAGSGSGTGAALTVDGGWSVP